MTSIHDTTCKNTLCYNKSHLSKDIKFWGIYNENMQNKFATSCLSIIM